MLFPKRGVEIIDEFLDIAEYARLANGDDDDRRLLTKAIAQQMRFELGPGWGVKSQSPTHPQSKDSLAFKLEGPGFLVWDWQNGSTRQRQITENTHGEHLTNQHFMPVDPFDLLGGHGSEMGDVLSLVQKIAQDQARAMNLLQLLLVDHSKLQRTLQTLVLEGRVMLGAFGNPRVVLSKKQD